MNKPVSQIWLERAIDAVERGDFNCAETRLIISDYLNPNDHAKRLLKVVKKRQLDTTPEVNFTQFRDRRVDSEECIIIAKISIERGDFEQAKKFLLLAEKICPHYYSRKLLKKVKYIENLRIRQEAKKKFAENWTEDARLQFEIGNYDKAEKLLVKSQKVFSTIRAQSLLKRVRDAKKIERQNAESNAPRRRKRILRNLGLKVLNILTCCIPEAYGYIRFDETFEEDSTNSDNNFGSDDTFFRNSENTGYSFRQSDIPHSRETFNNEFRRDRDGNRRSTQYNFRAGDIPENNRRNQTRGDTSNPRNNNGSGNNTREQNNASGSQNNARGAQNNPSGSQNNARGSQNNPSGSQNNARGSQNNARGSQNNPSGSQNNARGSQNNARGSQNNARQSGNNRSDDSWFRFFTRTTSEYTDEQLKMVDRVLNSKNDYERLGLKPTCKKQDVRAAFRKLALILHPDKNKAPRANEAFLLINDAKDRLLGKIN